MEVDGEWDGDVDVTGGSSMDTSVPTRVYLFQDTLDVEAVDFFFDAWSFFPRDACFFPVVSTQAAVLSPVNREKQTLFIDNLGVENNVHLLLEPSQGEMEEHQQAAASSSSTPAPMLHHMTTDWNCRTFLSSNHMGRLRQTGYLRRSATHIVKYGSVVKNFSSRWTAHEPLLIMEVSYLGECSSMADYTDAFSRFDELANEYSGFYVEPAQDKHRVSLQFLCSEQWIAEQYWLLMRRAFSLLKTSVSAANKQQQQQQQQQQPQQPQQPQQHQQ